MSVSIGLFAKGVLLGLGAAVPIGPVNVQIARHALRNGFVPGFALGCGAVTVDVMYAVLTSLGTQSLTQSAAVERTVTIAGFVLLTYLGVMCLRGEREAWRSDPVGAAGKAVAGEQAASKESTGKEPMGEASTRRGAGRAYVTGLLMTLLNPMTVAFWFIAVPALAGPVGGGDPRNLPLVCIGVFAGTIGWVILFAGTLALAGRFRRNWWLPLADAAGGAALLVFAAAALLSSLRAFL